MRGMIRWQGRAVPFQPGESAGSALARAGIVEFGRAASGLPRGLFCGIGQCQNCLILHDNQLVEACLLPCRDGMVLAPEDGGSHG